MTDPRTPSPGWYRERSDSSDFRWWDGREWTEHRSSAIGPVVVPQPPLKPGMRVNTMWAWVLSLVPLFALAGEQPLLLAFGPLIRRQAEAQHQLLTRPGSAVAVPHGFGDLSALFGISWGTSVLLIGMAALLAWLDWRALRRCGIVRPFPWGWGFLTGVYLVGRTVVLRRRVGRGLPPLILGIVLFVLAMAVQFGQFLVIFAAAGAAARG